MTATNPEGDALTAENPLELTAMNPDETGLGASVFATGKAEGGVGWTAGSPLLIEAFNAAEGWTAGGSEVNTSGWL